MAVNSHPSTSERPDHHRAGSAVIRAGAPLLAVAVAIAGLMWIVGSLMVHGLLPDSTAAPRRGR
jgi:hypothetical protein